MKQYYLALGLLFLQKGDWWGIIDPRRVVLARSCDLQARTVQFGNKSNGVNAEITSR